MRIRAACARWARAESRRSRTDLGDQQAVEVAWAVPETAGESGHAAAVDHAVGDEAHGPSDHLPAGVPLRGAGGGVGPAPLAPETAVCAAAAVGKKRTLPRLGVRAGQLGRQ